MAVWFYEENVLLIYHCNIATNEKSENNTLQKHYYAEHKQFKWSMFIDCQYFL